MSRVFLEVKVNLILDIDDGVDVSHVLNEMDYSFSDTTGSANILDTLIVDYNIKDSK